jgi:hypothetical protein
MEEENKYHFAREIIFNLKACKAITDKVYLHWIDKLTEDENQAKNNESLHDVSQNRELCEGKCGMSYCDDNGCIDRKRILVEPKDNPEHCG